MPFQLRSATLAAAATNTGIRVFTTSGNGDIREACLDLDTDEISQADKIGRRDIANQADHWYPGDLRQSCSPQSTLCAFAWGSWKESLFYQTSDNCIRETRHDWHWDNTSFIQPGALPGTDMAEVHSDGADRVIFFFQDKEGYLCCRPATNFNWQPVRRICKATLCTGIAATTWNNMKDVRVYYQNKDNAICERSANSDGSWSAEAFVSASQKPLGTLAAVSYHETDVVIRLYVQEEDSIVEWFKTGGSSSTWLRGHFKASALPNTDIIAFSRHIPTGVLVNVLWAGADQVLHQRVLTPKQSWLDPTPIAYLTTSGPLIGCWNGKHFTDNDLNINEKIIRKIIIRCGGVIDGLGLEFTDGTSTPWRGGQNGNRHEFALSEGEDIVQVAVSSFRSKQVWSLAAIGSVSSIKFITSNGRSSPTYGTEGDRPQVWSYQGHALAGFAGAADDFLNGLLPMWSERRTKIRPTSQEGLIAESNALGEEIQLSVDACQKYEAAEKDLELSIASTLHAPASVAIGGVNDLVHSLEKLHALNASTTKTGALVVHCKRQCATIAHHFSDLHEKAKVFVEKPASLMLEITQEASNMELRIKRVEDMLEVTETMRVCAVESQKMKRNLVEIAQHHISTARETKAAAERKKKDSKKARVVRDIFTLGLGEVGDWFNINEEIDHSDRTIGSAENKLHASELNLTEATGELQAIENQLGKFAQLKTTLDNYGPKLNTQVSRMGEVRNKTSELTNLSLDISIFLGTLAATTKNLKFNRTSEQFARSISTLAQLVGTTTAIENIERLVSMQKTLEFVAGSTIAVDIQDDIL